MSVRNTNIQQVDLNKVVRSSIQTGTIPIGPTGSSSLDNKYPVNISTPVLGNPRDNTGTTFRIDVKRIEKDFIIIFDNNWENKLKPGDLIQLVRGSLVRPYSIRQIFYNSFTNETLVYLFVKREDPKDLEKFVSSSSFPSPSSEIYVIVNKKVENPNTREELLKSFEVKMVKMDENNFSVKASWEIDPKVSVTKIRWRSVPDVKLSSSLSFFILTAGEYSQIPKVDIISDTGFLANIQLSGYINQVLVNETGSGYTYANVNIVSESGSGAQIDAIISSGSIIGFNVISGGSGYTSAPIIEITGDGTGASAYVTLIVDTITDSQEGGNYLSSPQIVVDSTYLVGLTGTEIACSYSLLNKSRVEYIRVLDGGTGYTGADVSITGSLFFEDATAVATIENGSVQSIDLTYPGYDYQLGADVSISGTGLNGSGASAIANIDLFSEWTYENPSYFEKERYINYLKHNVLYEMQILVSEDKFFRGIIKQT